MNPRFDGWRSLHEQFWVRLLVTHECRLVTATLHVDIANDCQWQRQLRFHCKGALSVPYRLGGIRNFDDFAVVARIEVKPREREGG